MYDKGTGAGVEHSRVRVRAGLTLGLDAFQFVRIDVEIERSCVRGEEQERNCADHLYELAEDIAFEKAAQAAERAKDEGWVTKR